MEEANRIDHEGSHPGPLVYVYVALVLAVVTAVEVVIVYQGLARALLVGMLMVLSVAKFLLVAMFFMHLRYDHRLFSVFFGGGMALATAVVVILLTLFGLIIPA